MSHQQCRQRRAPTARDRIVALHEAAEGQSLRIKALVRRTAAITDELESLDSDPQVKANWYKWTREQLLSGSGIKASASAHGWTYEGKAYKLNLTGEGRNFVGSLSGNFKDFDPKKMYDGSRDPAAALFSGSTGLGKSVAMTAVVKCALPEIAGGPSRGGPHQGAASPNSVCAFTAEDKTFTDGVGTVLPRACHRKTSEAANEFYRKHLKDNEGMDPFPSALFMVEDGKDLHNKHEYVLNLSTEARKHKMHTMCAFQRMKGTIAEAGPHTWRSFHKFFFFFGWNDDGDYQKAYSYVKKCTNSFFTSWEEFQTFLDAGIVDGFQTRVLVVDLVHKEVSIMRCTKPKPEEPPAPPSSDDEEESEGEGEDGEQEEEEEENAQLRAENAKLRAEMAALRAVMAPPAPAEGAPVGARTDAARNDDAENAEEREDSKEEEEEEEEEDEHDSEGEEDGNYDDEEDAEKEQDSKEEQDSEDEDAEGDSEEEEEEEEEEVVVVEEEEGERRRRLAHNLAPRAGAP